MINLAPATQPRTLRRVVDEMRHLYQILPTHIVVRYGASIALSTFGIFRSRHLWPADRKMTVKIDVEYKGAAIQVNCGQLDDLVKEDGCSSFSGIREMYARDVYLHPFDVSRIQFENVIDAGGNRGLFTAFASQLARCVVYIEPQVKYKPCLDRLLADNLTSCLVNIENAFLTNADALRSIEKAATARPIGAAPSVTLERIFEKYDLPVVSFFKCDIEGGEFSLFKDSTAWLPRIENVAMEVHRECGDPAIIVDILQRSGFVVRTAASNLRSVHVSQADYVYASRTGALKRVIYS